MTFSFTKRLLQIFHPKQFLSYIMILQVLLHRGSFLSTKPTGNSLWSRRITASVMNHQAYGFTVLEKPLSSVHLHLQHNRNSNHRNNIFEKQSASASLSRTIPSFFHSPNHPLLHRLYASSSTQTTTKSNTDNTKPIPITLLSGFLGAGKTSTLSNLLTNNVGLKIGIIVNDVASVNIDAKLISNPNNKNNNNNSNQSSQFVLSGDDTIELQNGCACCSLADELLTSVEKLMNGGKRSFDVIVVELSGVADPVAVKMNWENAIMMDHPATKLASIDKVVTLIDSSTFGTDFMSWDNFSDRDGWSEPGDDCAAQRKVPELLAEQVEAADILLLNKIDIAGREQVEVAKAVAFGLNNKAEILEVEFGNVPLENIFGGPDDDEDESHDHDHDHHDSSSCSDPKCTDPTHDHDHSHSHEHNESSSCADPKCTDPTHDHDHSHEHNEASSCSDPKCTDPTHDHDHSHEHNEASSCSDPKCTDPTHDHDHSHEHNSSCADPTCTDPTHDHDHSHSHDHNSSCADPTCTDPSHNHDHSHDHSSTSTKNLGITNFVYKSTIPFNAQRLLSVLNKWPVPIKDTLDLDQLTQASKDGYNDGEGGKEKSPFIGVLRSKGFCWLSPTKWNGSKNDIWRHDTAMYWSHAGKHFGIATAGKWWGTLTKEQMKSYFKDNEKEYNRILKEDWVSDEWGDRRQEIVFIGTNLVDDDIRKALDACLCTDEEMKAYRQQVRNFLDTTFTTTASSVDGPSLFDVGGTNHVDSNVNIRGD